MYTSLWTNAIEDPDRNTIVTARKTEKPVKLYLGWKKL